MLGFFSTHFVLGRFKQRSVTLKREQSSLLRALSLRECSSMRVFSANGCALLVFRVELNQFCRRFVARDSAGKHSSKTGDFNQLSSSTHTTKVHD